MVYVLTTKGFGELATVETFVWLDEGGVVVVAGIPVVEITLTAEVIVPQVALLVVIGGGVVIGGFVVTTDVPLVVEVVFVVIEVVALG